MVNMVIDKKTIRLLILEDSENEAERIVSLFRNSGHATRAHRIASLDDLNDALKNIWDLCIAADNSEQLDPLTCLQAIHKMARDIPFIQLCQDESSDTLTDALQMGEQNDET